jgi:hypothetical protein
MGWKSKEAANAYSREYVKNHPEAKAKKLLYQQIWRKTDNGRKRLSASKYKYRDKLKERVLLHYGNGKIECAYCGFDNIDALCIDHINNDGAEHRKKAGISSRGGVSGFSTFAALLRDKMPEGLQVLCANCNMIKELKRKREKRLQNPFYNKKEVLPDANRNNNSL